MAERTIPRSPTGLGSTGKRLWRDVHETYDLRPDEHAVLEEACRTRDLLYRMEKELAKGNMIASGSMGQPVAHPFLAEVRQHRITMQRLLITLGLPDAVGETGARGESTSRSASARALANARWRRGA